MNTLGTEGDESFKESLKVNTTLTELDFDWTGYWIRNFTLEMIVSVLGRHSFLNLSSNSILYFFLFTNGMMKKQSSICWIILYEKIIHDWLQFSLQSLFFSIVFEWKVLRTMKNVKVFWYLLFVRWTHTTRKTFTPLFL